jgi:small-conductance mechanosensitive channel
MDERTGFDFLLADWLSALGLVLAAALLAELGFRLGRRLFLHATRSAPLAASTGKAVQAPARFLLYLWAIHLLRERVLVDLPWLPGAERLTTLLLIFTFTWLLARAVHGLAKGVVRANPLAVADNLEARRIQTQTQVLSRVVQGMVWFVGAALMLVTFPAVREIGASLLASAGVLGIVAGFAARPVLGNIIAGLQIGISQPIRLDDVVIVEGEWGVIEKITGTYVVVRIWDDRRLIVPLQYWIEKPFQNWTRTSAELTGTVYLWVDYSMPLAPLREALQRACEASELWDRRLALLQVTEAGERAMQLRCLVTAASAAAAWDLRCHVRESLIEFMQQSYPHYLARQRAEVNLMNGPQSSSVA